MIFGFFKFIGWILGVSHHKFCWQFLVHRFHRRLQIWHVCVRFLLLKHFLHDLLLSIWLWVKYFTCSFLLLLAFLRLLFREPLQPLLKNIWAHDCEQNMSCCSLGFSLVLPEALWHNFSVHEYLGQEPQFRIGLMFMHSKPKIKWNFKNVTYSSS